MEYLHQSHYGHAGGLHTARPIMAMDKGHIYDMKNGRPDLTKPIYRVADSKVYATEHHPDGASPHALFEIRGDKVHTTEFHPAHSPATHVYEVRGGLEARSS
ncbi:MAG: hypothetical protein JO019_02390 [Candidatus Kaiserbacteria bacterium]|nr:hypothetical protein [Candidatus Kaiserbacteria bacterium]